MPAPFKRLSVEEFALLLDRFPFSRQINCVHMHHTWRPNHGQFRGHDSIVAMWDHHTRVRHFSDIAQHLTIDPEGHLWMGRNWNAPPASASGFNGNSARGPFMFETIGDFDVGMDALASQQRNAVLDVIKLVQARFGLSPETLMFHNQMSTKSCPGTSIKRDAFLLELAQHPLPASGGQRGDTTAPFAPSSLASSEAVREAIELLTREGARAVDPSDAELDCEDHLDGGDASRESGVRGPDDDLDTDSIEELRAHVINLRAGGFSSDGKMTTTPGDVDAIFDEHLPRWVDALKAEGDVARVVFFAHGGLVKESAGLAIAHRARAWWLRNKVYPVYFCWESGLFETIGDLLTKVRRRTQPEGVRDVFDWTSDPLLEEAARALQAPRIWGGMKASAAAASAANGGARYVAKRLGQWMKTHGANVELHAVGHSAGSIFHAHFLPACLDEGVTFTGLQLLAPAITAADFKRYLERMQANGGASPPTTLFTMNRTLERADHCANVYRKSLLYLVSEACERKRKTPILGLEDTLRDDTMLRSFFGLQSVSASGSVVWSKSATDTGRSATRSTSHGGFDDDAPTMGSVLRRIRDLADTDAIVPFPSASAGRSAQRPWTEEVDWPAAFERKWTAPAPQRMSVAASTAPDRPTAGKREGRLSAVCIGIDTYDASPLKGCVADAVLWQKTLAGLGFDASLIKNEDATRKRLVKALSDLIGSSRAGDAIVFQYSGHGTQVDDIDGDEAHGDTPGLDEALCPFDYEDGHFLIDDDISAEIVKLPDDVRLTFLLDCCHSGTGTRFAVRGASRNLADARPRFIVPSRAQRDAHRKFRAANGNGANRVIAIPAASAMREVTFSACRSNEVAWESDGHGEFTRRAHEVLANRSDGLSNVGFLEAVVRAFGSSARQQPQLDCDVSYRSGRWLGL